MSKLENRTFVNLLTGKLVNRLVRVYEHENEVSDSMKADLKPYPSEYTLKIVDKRIKPLV